MSDTVTVTMSQLVHKWEELVTKAQTLEMVPRPKSVSRFATIEAGQKRIANLESTIRAFEQGLAAAGPFAALVEPVAEPVTATPVVEEDDMAKRKSKSKTKTVKAKRAPRGKNGNGTSIKAKTKEYNDLVAANKSKVPSWARHHKSDFGSHEMADKQLKRLRAAI